MDRLKFLETLEVVGKGLERNSLIPDFDFFHFIDGIIYAGHEDFTIVSPLTFKPKDNFAVHGPTLLGMLKSSKSREVFISLDTPAKGPAKVSVGFTKNSEFELPFTGADTFIWKRPEVPNSTIYRSLYDGIAACLITCSSDLALEGFNRICIGEYKGKLAMYSCDGDSLTRYVTDVKSKLTGTMCISRAFADIIVKVAKGNAEFMVGSEHIKVSTEDGLYEIYGKNLGPSTMDYESIIASKLGEGALHGLIPVPVNKSLSECLDRARVLTNVETAPTEVVIEDGDMYLQTETQRGNALDSLRTSHADITIQISAEKVQQALEGCSLFKFTPSCSVFSAGEKLLRIVGNFEDKKGGADG